MPKFSVNCVGALLLAAAFGSTGCNSLKARMIAGDAANLYHEGKLEEAIAKYEEAASFDANIATIELNLGFANLALYQQNPKSKTGENAANKAVTAFEGYLRLKPNDERGRQYLVQTFVDTSRYDAAVSYFQPQVQKNDPEAFNTLGLIANKTGNFPAAKDWYTKRIAADPKNADARVTLGVLIWDYLHNHKEVAGDQRKQISDEAIGILKEAIDLAPKAPNAYTYTSLTYRERAEADLTDDEKRPDLEKAVKYFKKAMELQKAAK
jgi:tetratricopeptide (TPR) repeat protein